MEEPEVCDVALERVMGAVKLKEAECDLALHFFDVAFREDPRHALEKSELAFTAVAYLEVIEAFKKKPQVTPDTVGEVVGRSLNTVEQVNTYTAKTEILMRDKRVEAMQWLAALINSQIERPPLKFII